MSDAQIIEAVKAGDVAELKRLAEAGVDINQQDEQGWTPLIWAAGKGNLPAVELLVEKGADVAKVGRDQRTPYLVALAAGHQGVARFLRDAEEGAGVGSRPERKYCKAYHLSALRQFPGWSEENVDWKGRKGHSEASGESSEDSVVFLHQDCIVTKSMWHNENVVFNQVTPEWREFCENTLEFKVPDDLDLIASAKAANQ